MLVLADNEHICICLYLRPTTSTRPVLVWLTTNIFSYVYFRVWPTTSTWSGRLGALAGSSLGPGGTDLSCRVDLLPAWLWCCVGLCVFSGFPLSLPSYAWINAFRNKWREWGGWWVAGVEPLPPTPPVLRALTSARLDPTRDYKNNVIGSSFMPR